MDSLDIDAALDAVNRSMEDVERSFERAAITAEASERAVGASARVPADTVGTQLHTVDMMADAGAAQDDSVRLQRMARASQEAYDRQASAPGAAASAADATDMFSLNVATDLEHVFALGEAAGDSLGGTMDALSLPSLAALEAEVEAQHARLQRMGVGVPERPGAV